MLSKQKIEEKLINGDINDLEMLINEYEEKYSDDYDILSLKATYYIYIGNLEKAKKYAIEAVKRDRYDVESIYNLATIYELNNEMELAYEYYMKTIVLEKIYRDNIIDINEVTEKAKEVMNVIIRTIDNTKDKALKKIRVDKLKTLDRKIKEIDSYNYNVFNNGKSIIGTIFKGTDLKKYYIGRCDDWIHSYFAPGNCKNTIETKCEMYELYRKSNEVILNLTKDSIVPIVSNLSPESKGNKIVFYNKDQYEIFESEKCTYNYFRLSGKTKIKAVNPIIVGKPIELVQHNNNKKLILNIFIDSLSYDFMKKNNYAELMPNTYSFFNKGIICDNVYSNCEFTYPSISTYVTGLYSSHHMMLNSDVHLPLPTDVTLLAEYFKDNGYFTAKIGGNDSISPNYGYSRGIDRCVYQQQRQGLNVQQVVSDVLEQIEAFKETNQFVWMDVVDLHDVAGGFRRPISIQSKLSLKDREIDNGGGNTVKQSYSINKQVIFKEELKRIDFYLNFLYEYIENNYKDDEIIISLFSDHGTAFMVKNEDEFLCRTRTNVPLMIRSDYRKEKICKEIISTADYMPIMCKLAGIKMKDEKIDGRLPKYFGGKTERKFAFAQSIFPGDPYKAALHGKDFSYYINGKDAVSTNCLINLDKCESKLVDRENNVIEDQEAKEVYKNEIKKNLNNIYVY